MTHLIIGWGTYFVKPLIGPYQTLLKNVFYRLIFLLLAKGRSYVNSFLTIFKQFELEGSPFVNSKAYFSLQKTHLGKVPEVPIGGF